MRPRTVLVAHADRMVAEGLAAALEKHPWLAVVGAATASGDVLERGSRAEAVALDERLGDLAPMLRARGARVVLLGEADDAVSLSSPAATLAWALAPDAASPDRRGTLSRREREVLALVARGLPAKTVARQLGISPKTVEHHKSSIYEKLGVGNQAAAVRVAYVERVR